MAGLFLSYARDDEAKAKQIAAALEKAGHSVWWDLHVRGGTQYSKAIEDALEAADLVVVLWSTRSIESPWVRDEAAAGRDRGRLVPICLDKTGPPIGFRQFQTIDLSDWKGRRPVPRLPVILHAIDGALGEAGKRPEVQARTKARALPEMSRVLRLTLITVLGFAAIAAAYFLVDRGKGNDVRTVAIKAADPSSARIARDLLDNLADIRSVQTGSVELVNEAGNDRAELIFEARTAPANGGAYLALMHGQDRSLLWSKEFLRKEGTPADLELQIAYTAGRVLGCAIDGLALGGKALRPQTLKLYLNGCSQFAEGSDEARMAVIPIFERVVGDAPGFAAGWAKLLLAESDAVAADATRDREALQRHVARARDLDPQMPELTLARVTLLPTKAYGEGLRLLDRANEDHPGNAMILGFRSHALSNVGRMTEAIEDAKEALRLDPTSPDAWNNYARVLAYAGRVDAARAELQRAERLWPGTGRLAELQWALKLRFGDPKELLTSEQYKEANPRLQFYYRTRADPTPAKVDRFVAFLSGLYSRRGLTADDIVGHSQAYGEFDREDRLFELISRLPPGEDLSALSAVVFRPSLREFRHDPRFMTVAKRIGLLDYWTKSGKWPDFCFDPDQPYDCKAEAAKLSRS